MKNFQEILAQNSAMLDERIALGDLVQVPRIVEHFAYFKNRANAERAKSELESIEFDVAITRRFARILLTAEKESAVDHASAMAFSRKVFDVIVSCGGSYDGWGAEVVEGS